MTLTLRSYHDTHFKIAHFKIVKQSAGAGAKSVGIRPFEAATSKYRAVQLTLLKATKTAPLSRNQRSCCAIQL